jgi:hypothetical protein
MISAEALRRLSALNLPPDAMCEVLSIFADMQSAEEERLAKQRDRKRKSRDSHGTVTGQERDMSRDPLSPKKGPPHPPKNNPLPQPSANAEGTVCDFFDEFWGVYPRREGENPKKPAKASFSRALRKGADPRAIISGAKALAAKHPLPSPFVPQAVTWLNQERWSDTVATGPPETVIRFRTVEEVVAEQMEKKRAAGNGTISGP